METSKSQGRLNRLSACVTEILSDEKIAEIRWQCEQVKEFGIRRVQTAAAVYMYFTADIPALLDEITRQRSAIMGYAMRGSRSYAAMRRAGRGPGNGACNG